MKTWFATIALVMALAQVGWGEAWRFNPGVGVGPLKLNADYLSPAKLLTPGEGFPTSTGFYLKYKEGLETECTGKRITQIVVMKTSFTTRSGPVEVQFPGNLKIDSSVQQMQAALGVSSLLHNMPTAKGRPVRTYYAYPSQGLGVIAEGGKLIQFDVFQKR